MFVEAMRWAWKILLGLGAFNLLICELGLLGVVNYPKETYAGFGGSGVLFAVIAGFIGAVLHDLTGRS